LKGEREDWIVAVKEGSFAAVEGKRVVVEVEAGSGSVVGTGWRRTEGYGKRTREACWRSSGSMMGGRTASCRSAGSDQLLSLNERSAVAAEKDLLALTGSLTRPFESRSGSARCLEVADDRLSDTGSWLEIAEQEEDQFEALLVVRGRK
jgi:hypothetical protein